MLRSELGRLSFYLCPTHLRHQVLSGCLVLTGLPMLLPLHPRESHGLTGKRSELLPPALTDLLGNSRGVLALL